MTAQEVALQSYQLFKNGDIEGLKALCHDDYTMTLNGMHRLSGTYRGADSFVQDLLANIPAALPGFSLKVVDSFGSEDGTKAFVIVDAEADGLKDSLVIICGVKTARLWNSSLSMTHKRWLMRCRR